MTGLAEVSMAIIAGCTCGLHPAMAYEVALVNNMHEGKGVRVDTHNVLTRDIMSKSQKQIARQSSQQCSAGYKVYMHMHTEWIV